MPTRHGFQASGFDAASRHRPVADVLRTLLHIIVLTAYGCLGASAGKGTPPAAESPPVILSEFLAENRSGLMDDDGDHSDWVELFNRSGSAVNLLGWSLTDDDRSLRKWVFPETILAPGRFLVLFASGKERRSPSRPLHTNFKLAKKGGYLGLVKPDGESIASAFSPAYPAQRSDIAYGLPESFFQARRRPDGGYDAALPLWTFLPLPTPGASNLPGAGTSVLAPVFSLPSGLYGHAIQVSLSPVPSGVRVFCSTDGTHPSPTNGLLYSQPLTLKQSTVLRAVAYGIESLPSPATEVTYLIESSVRTQTGEGLLRFWGEREGKPVVADYEMDPEVLGGVSSQGLHEALLSLPSLCLNIDPADLFSSERGIYSNPMQNGGDWERAATLEILPWRGELGSRVDCGVRIQGGWNRRPEESPKHAFRIVFKKRYGPSTWKHSLFGGQGEEFDELILRAGCNNSWLHWSSDERRHGDYLRDQWMRETYAALGQVSAKGRFVHLYLNGLYWGVYNCVERPAAGFVRSHMGGKASDYEVRNADHILEGSTNAWGSMLARANKGLEDAGEFAAICEVLDLPCFIDYLLLNLFAGNADYDRSSNWYAFRPSRPGGLFRFVVWDGERTLEEASSNTLDYDDDESPPRLFQKLRGNDTFRARFAERARQLLAPGGALSVAECQARYSRLADSIEKAMLLESARWGDYRRDVHPYKTPPYELYTVEKHWRPEVRRLIDDYFPARCAEFARQLKAAGLL